MPPTFASAPGGFGFSPAPPRNPVMAPSVGPTSPVRTTSKSPTKPAPSSPAATAPSSSAAQAQMMLLLPDGTSVPVGPNQHISLGSAMQRRPMPIGYHAPSNGGAAGAVGAARLIETDPLTEFEMENRTALEPEKKDRTKMIVIGAIALIVIVVVGVVIWRRMKK